MKFTALFALSAAALIQSGQTINLSQQTKVSSGIKQEIMSQGPAPQGVNSSLIYNNANNAVAYATLVGSNLTAAAGSNTQAGVQFAYGDKQITTGANLLVKADTNLQKAQGIAQTGLTAAQQAQTYIDNAQSYENAIPALLKQEADNIASAMGFYNTLNTELSAIIAGCSSSSKAASCQSLVQTNTSDLTTALANLQAVLAKYQ